MKLLKNNPIFITTFKARSLPTVNNLPSGWHDYIIVVVSNTKDQEWVHEQYPGIATLLVPTVGISETREALLNHAIKSDIECLIMLDDDLQFKSAIWEENKKRFRNSTAEQMVESFTELIEKALASPLTAYTAHGSAFFNDTDKIWDRCKGNTYSFFVNVKTAQLSGAYFDQIPTMEDVQFSLLSYTAGYPSYSHMSHSVVDVGKKGTTGEAAHKIPRSNRHEAAAEILVERFPGIVRIRDNKSKSHMENIGTTIDVTVRWKAALKE